MIDLLRKPHTCPKCEALHWGAFECRKCGWIDPRWKAYVERMEVFWEEHKDELEAIYSLLEGEAIRSEERAT